jgi:hypothetical protein
MKQKMIKEVRISMGAAPDEDEDAWARKHSSGIGSCSLDPWRFVSPISNPPVVLACLRRRTIARCVGGRGGSVLGMPGLRTVALQRA